MTQKAAICKALLDGKTLSIMTGFRDFGCTNIPREISRSVVNAFGIMISIKEVKFRSRYGHSGIYYEYSLNKKTQNPGALKKMQEYVYEQKSK